MSHNPYASNVYKIKTTDNFRITVKFSQYSQGTINYLSIADVELLPMATILQPFSTNVNDKYVNWFIAKHLSLSATNQQNIVEAAMPANVKKLETAVLSVYDEGTTGYNNIFSRPKSHLYDNVTQQQKLVNLKTESALLVGLVPLSAAKIALDVYIKSFDDTLKASANAQTKLTETSNQMEEARIEWCDEALGVTGKLLEKYKLNPEKIDDIFDMAMFNPRHSHIDPDKDTLNVIVPEDSIFSINMVFDPSKTYYLHNTGICALNVGSASAIDQQTLTTFITLGIDETKIASGALLGDLLNRYLLVWNEDPTIAGELKIKEEETIA